MSQVFSEGTKVIRVSSENSWIPVGAKGVVAGPDPQRPNRLLVTWGFIAAVKGDEALLQIAPLVSSSAHKMVAFDEATDEQKALIEKQAMSAPQAGEERPRVYNA